MPEIVLKNISKSFGKVVAVDKNAVSTCLRTNGMWDSCSRIMRSGRT